MNDGKGMSIDFSLFIAHKHGVRHTAGVGLTRVKFHNISFICNDIIVNTLCQSLARKAVGTAARVWPEDWERAESGVREEEEEEEGDEEGDEDARL
mmetsp:Transcript_23435/g.59167  ORF Transcript_23435/g.59167 Transcript_23435/m.59167 type:complete len:96 (-) Transcript_23435:325-612(-)